MSFAPEAENDWMRHEDGGTMCLLLDGDLKVMHG